MTVTIRQSLDALVGVNFTTYPADDQNTLTSLMGVEIAPNNFFDTGIDVFAFIEDIETVSQQIDRFFAATYDIEALEAYLQVNNAAYYDTFISQSNSIQDSVNQVFDDATPGFADYLAGNFTLFWESISGLSTTFYSAIVTTAGGLGAIFDGVDDELDVLGAVFHDDVAANLGVATVEIAAVANFSFVVSDKLTSIGERVAASFADISSTNFAANNVAMLQDINSILSAYDSVETILTGTPVTGQLQAVFDFISELATIADFIGEQDAMIAALDDPNLAQLSRDFLDNAITINALELVDSFANIVASAQSFFNVGGQAAGLVSYFAEGLRTVSDIVSLTMSNGWQIEADRFAQYDSLGGILSNYQTLLQDALDEADELSGGTWGDNINSTQPSAPLPARSVFENRYDMFLDAAIEQGSIMTLGTTIAGTVNTFDDGDWFEIDLLAGTDYRFEVVEGTINSGDILIYNGLGQFVARTNAAESSATNWVIEGGGYRHGLHDVGGRKLHGQYQPRR